MSLLQDMRSLWKIPAAPRREDNDSKDSTSLAKSIGISDSDVINMSPATLWKKYLDYFLSTLAPTESAIAIMGDPIRGRSEEKNLPCAYFASLMREFPFDRRCNIVVTVRNELGNSLPVELSESNCQQFFTSLVRETGEEVPNIPESSWRGVFFRSKFSARLTVSDGNISSIIRVIVCSHDLTSLPTEQANFSAYQPFISNDAIPDNSRFTLVCILGLSVAFTLGATKRIISRLAPTTNSTGYEVLAEILRSHVRQWTTRRPGPEYEVRQYITSKAKQRESAEQRNPVEPKTPTRPNILPFKSKVTGQTPRRQITMEKSGSKWAPRIPPSLPTITESSAPASSLTSNFRSKIPQPSSQLGQYRKSAAVPRRAITFHKLPQNNNQSSHRSSHKGKEVYRAPEPMSNELEESQLGTIYQVGSSSMNRSPPPSPDWLAPISVRGPPQASSLQTSAVLLQPPAINYSPSLSPLDIPPQLLSALSRLLTATTPIKSLSIREFIALSLTVHCIKSIQESRVVTVTPTTPRGSTLALSFLNNRIIGLILESHETEVGIVKPKDTKTCPFGCLLCGKHQHLLGTTAVYSHIGAHPPVCPCHPDFFTGDFEEVKDIVKVVIWFRKTHQKTSWATGLYAVGRGLLKLAASMRMGEWYLSLESEIK